MAATLERGAYVRMLTAVYAALFLIRVAFGISLVTFPLYITDTNAVLGLISTAAPLLELITVIFAGVFIDRYGRKGILLAGLGLGAISLYGLALTREPLLLGLVNAVHGVAAAFILVTTLAVIATYAPPAHRGREMGLFNFINLFGLVAGYVGGFLLTDLFADRLEYTFVIAGALATGGLLYANRMLHLPDEGVRRPEATGHEPPSLKDLGKVVANQRLVLLILPWLIVFMLVNAFLTFFPRVTDSLALSGLTTALAVLGGGVILVGAQLFWGRMADRIGHEEVMLVGAAGFALLMGTIVYAFFETPSHEPGEIFANVLGHSVLLAIFLFTALAFAPAGLAAIANEARAGTQGTTMGAYSVTLSLGLILGPSVVGGLADVDSASGFGGRLLVVFFAGLAVAFLGLVLLLYVKKKRPGRVAETAMEEGG